MSGPNFLGFPLIDRWDLSDFQVLSFHTHQMQTDFTLIKTQRRSSVNLFSLTHTGYRIKQ